MQRAQPDDVENVNGHLRVRIRGTKTKASERVIPVPGIFVCWFKWARAHLPFRRWRNSRRDILAACKRAGVPAVTWNDLRRTFASLLVQEGVSPAVVAQLLGHTSTAMVDRVYGRQTTETLTLLLQRQPGLTEQ